MNLADQTYIPHAPLLTADEVAQLHPHVPHWVVHGTSRIVRALTFADFAQALHFANVIGKIADAAHHHPDLHLGYGRLTVELTTHDAGGLTANDFIEAAQIEAAWLARHIG